MLNTNSDNSSVPPSSDKHKKREKAANEYNGRDAENSQSDDGNGTPKEKRKQGGQKGRTGTALTEETIESLIESGNCIVRREQIGDPANGKV